MTSVERVKEWLTSPRYQGKPSELRELLLDLIKDHEELLLCSFNEAERDILRRSLTSCVGDPAVDEILRKLALAPKDKLAVGDRVVTSDGYRGIVEQLSGPRAVSVRYHRGYVATEDPTTLTKELPWK